MENLKYEFYNCSEEWSKELNDIIENIAQCKNTSNTLLQILDVSTKKGANEYYKIQELLNKRAHELVENLGIKAKG